MKITNWNEATAARSQKLFNLFRGLTRSRMLWISAGMLFFGIMGGGWIYSHSLPGSPLQNRPTQQAEMVSMPVTQTAAEQSLAQETAPPSVAQPQTKPEVLGAAVPETPACNEQERLAAIERRALALQAEENRFITRFDSRRGLRQLFTALTGNANGPATQQDIDRHEANKQAIEAAYQQQLAMASCSDQ